uniref:Uncharacterized protein n=1 Tax=Stomoxys calcitrans TaxID=35570 RepID=A0A1I8QFE7_STOCA
MAYEDSYVNTYYPEYTAHISSRPRPHSVHPFRHLVASSTNLNGAWEGGGSAHSGYGPEPMEYDYHTGPQAHAPMGDYSYHSAAGTGYGGPPPAYHAPVHVSAKPAGGGKKKSGGARKRSSHSSTMTALTLLSFFFFVNLLQNCIKDHMDYMHPTVMVMTPDIRRKSFNKMGEMNSREQSSGISAAGVVATNEANIVMQPADMLASAAFSSSQVMEAMKPYVNLQSPYSSVNKPMEVLPNRPAQPAPAGPPVVAQYQNHHAAPAEVQHQRPPSAYDPHQPDVYEQHLQHNYPGEHIPAVPAYNPSSQEFPKPLLNENPLVNQQQPPVYMGSSKDHPSAHHEYTPAVAPIQHHSHDEMMAAAASSVSGSFYSTTRNPFLDHKYPNQSPAYTPQSDHGFKQPSSQNYHRYPPKNNAEDSAAHQGPVPWSSTHSMVSSAVMSAPIRRATIVSVSPTIKWISLPSNVDDHADFDDDVPSSELRRDSRYGETTYQRKFP